MAITKATKVSISINMLIQLATLIFILGGGWFAFQAHAARLDSIETEQLPAIESQARISSNAIIQIQSDIKYIRENQAKSSVEQASLRQEIKSDQKETRSMLRSMLKEMKK